MPVGVWLEGALSPTWKMALMALLLVVNAFTLTYIGTYNMLYGAKSYLPAVCYAATCCGVFFSGDSLMPVVASFFVVMGLNAMIPGLRHGTSFDRCFRGAFVMGCSMLFYAPAAMLAVVLPIMLPIWFRSAREVITALIGLALPLAGGSYVGLLMGLPGDFMIKGLIEGLMTPSGVQTAVFTNPLLIVSASVMVLTLFLSLGSFLASTVSMRTRPYRIVMSMTVMLAAIPLMLLFPGRAPELVNMLAVPVSVIAPFLFNRYTGVMPLIIYLLWIVSAVAVNFTVGI
ncbi:hypothetical protein FACS1894159_02880 [Bacteroidia bacterium]|nr:hypothetical protein FACS1894159_02880 [Bacteroidia bacterium]